MTRLRWYTIPVVTVALLAAACGGSKSSSNEAGGGSNGTTVPLPDCPVHALDNATTPVDITVWYAYGAKIADTLKSLADQYNASQTKVRVTLQSQGTDYRELKNKYDQAAPSKALPAISIMEDNTLKTMADSGTVLPAQSCINADNYDTSDLLPTAVASYSLDGALIPASLNLSSELLYYNRNHFRKAGLDPEKPPTTLAELRQYAEQIKAAGVVDKPLVLLLQPWYIETWLTGSGQSVVNNDNGRGTGTTDQAVFDNDPTTQIYTWIQKMYQDGLMAPVANTPGAVDQYLALANQQSSITIETSAAATSVKAFLKGDQLAGVSSANVDLSALDINAGKFPGVSQAGKIQIAGGAWFMTNTGTPEQQAAAWDFMKWWNKPDTQVQWNLEGSYLPFSMAAAKDARLIDAWKNDVAGRWLAISYDQLLTGVDPKFPGPVMGPYEQFREAMRKSLEALVFNGQAPATAVADAASQTTAALKQYNSGGF